MPRLLLVDDNPSIHRIAESLLAPTDVELVCVDSAAEARALMLLRANVLAKGVSGIREQALDLLLAMLDLNVVAVVPERGSVGASGDLAPLAHLALAELVKYLPAHALVNPRLVIQAV